MPERVFQVRQGGGDVRLEWIYKGRDVAAEFVVKVHDEKVEPWHIGIHSTFAPYDFSSDFGKCDVLGTDHCYFDSGLTAARELWQRVKSEGEDAIWMTLEERYEAHFEQAMKPMVAR